jgi:hypothetical protein
LQNNPQIFLWVIFLRDDVFLYIVLGNDAGVIGAASLVKVGKSAEIVEGISK